MSNVKGESGEGNQVIQQEQAAPGTPLVHGYAYARPERQGYGSVGPFLNDGVDDGFFLGPADSAAGEILGTESVVEGWRRQAIKEYCQDAQCQNYCAHLLELRAQRTCTMNVHGCVFSVLHLKTPQSLHKLLLVLQCFRSITVTQVAP